MRVNYSILLKRYKYRGIDVKWYTINEMWSERLGSEEKNWPSFDRSLLLYTTKFIKNNFSVSEQIEEST